jgi:hypothetical protein
MTYKNKHSEISMDYILQPSVKYDTMYMDSFLTFKQAAYVRYYIIFYETGQHLTKIHDI